MNTGLHPFYDSSGTIVFADYYSATTSLWQPQRGLVFPPEAPLAFEKKCDSIWRTAMKIAALILVLFGLFALSCAISNKVLSLKLLGGVLSSAILASGSLVVAAVVYAVSKFYKEKKENQKPAPPPTAASAPTTLAATPIPLEAQVQSLIEQLEEKRKEFVERYKKTFADSHYLQYSNFIVAVATFNTQIFFSAFHELEMLATKEQPFTEERKVFHQTSDRTAAELFEAYCEAWITRDQSLEMHNIEPNDSIPRYRQQLNRRKFEFIRKELPKLREQFLKNTPDKDQIKEEKKNCRQYILGRNADDVQGFFHGDEAKGITHDLSTFINAMAAQPL